VVFASHSGGTTSYIAANFNNTGDTGTISNWLMTPVVTIQTGAEITFWTRTATGSINPDRLQIRASTAGSSTNIGTSSTDVGDFTLMLLDINPNYQQGGYPDDWASFTATVTGVPTAMTGRFAFRYFVEDAGLTGANSDYIGIDDACTSAQMPPPPPPPPPPPARCGVPRVVGLALGRAKTKIRRAHCSVGAIRRVHSGRPGRVIRQSPRPGTIKHRGFPVKLVVGRR